MNLPGDAEAASAAGLASEGGSTVAASAIGAAGDIRVDAAASPALPRPGLPPLLWGAALVVLTLAVLATLA